MACPGWSRVVGGRGPATTGTWGYSGRVGRRAGSAVRESGRRAGGLLRWRVARPRGEVSAWWRGVAWGS